MFTQCLEAAKKDAKKAVIAERLENALSEASTIEAVAATTGKEVRTLSFRISQFNIAGVGNEAAVVSAPLFYCRLVNYAPIGCIR